MTQLPSRRGVIGGLAGLGACACLPVFAGAAAPAKRAIDFHHHFSPPFLARAANNGARAPGGGLNWDIGYSLDDMDKAGIRTAVLSPPTGFATALGGDERAGLVRMVNDFGAGLVRDHAGRYRQFVYLPLPDVDASLKEIAYGFDTLKVMGAVFATSYGPTYVSDDSFQPVFEELNRRKAIAYFHPLAGTCCTKIIPDVAQETALAEIPYDTGRAVLGLFFKGAFRRYPDINWVFSHSGGAIPMFAGRFNRLLQGTDLSKIAPDGVSAELRKLYYETANASSPPTMAALLKFAPLSQVLFGSDHPYVSDADNMTDLTSCHLSGREMNAILYGNAERIAPELKT